MAATLRHALVQFLNLLVTRLRTRYSVGSANARAQRCGESTRPFAPTEHELKSCLVRWSAPFGSTASPPIPRRLLQNDCTYRSTRVPGYLHAYGFAPNCITDQATAASGPLALRLTPWYFVAGVIESREDEGNRANIGVKFMTPHAIASRSGRFLPRARSSR